MRSPIVTHSPLVRLPLRRKRRSIMLSYSKLELLICAIIAITVVLVLALGFR